MSQSASPLQLIEHVIDNLNDHASALRNGTVGQPQAQARWLSVQVLNLEEAAAKLKETGRR